MSSDPKGLEWFLVNAGGPWVRAWVEWVQCWVWLRFWGP